MIKNDWKNKQALLFNDKGRIKIDGYAIFRYGTTGPSEWVYLKEPE